jgi:hypothetical protein
VAKLAEDDNKRIVYSLEKNRKVRKILSKRKWV